MSQSPITLDVLGVLLRQIQAEQRTLRGENELIRADLGRLAGAMVTREQLADVVRIIADRIGNFEALMETRLDGLEALIRAERREP